MNVDIAAASSFLAGNARILDRRRFEHQTGSADGVATLLAALDGYRNADGGFGWGIEPDLRSPESQPTGAMHAFEVLAEIVPTTSNRSVELCDWLAERTLPDGGLPFTVPVTDPAGCAPWWLGGDVTTSSLQMTGQVAANALRVAGFDRRVADHSWLARATAWCADAINRLDGQPFAYELLFAVEFANALAVTDPKRAAPLVEHLGQFIPPDGIVAVQGGAADEVLRPLDFAPRPDAAFRARFADDVVAADLKRLAAGQQPDGGWTVDFVSASPAAALEWRSYATVEALATLRSNGS